MDNSIKEKLEEIKFESKLIIRDMVDVAEQVYEKMKLGHSYSAALGLTSEVNEKLRDLKVKGSDKIYNTALTIINGILVSVGAINSKNEFIGEKHAISLPTSADYDKSRGLFIMRELSGRVKQESVYYLGNLVAQIAYKSMELDNLSLQEAMQIAKKSQIFQNVANEMKESVENEAIAYILLVQARLRPEPMLKTPKK